MGIVEQCLLQLNKEKRRWRKAVVILTALSLVVALFTVWNLRMTGITIANSATCGYEEHQHTEECPHEKVLICEGHILSDEEDTGEAEATPDLPEEPTEPEHTEECYEIVYTCELEEHIHRIAC